MTNDKKPIISVLMAAYNAEDTISDTIKSILSQNFEEFEFIIIDDGSVDGTRKIINSFAEVDNRIRFYSRENRGLGKTRNELIGMAIGEYCAIVDADDISTNDRLMLQFKFLEKNQECVLVGTQLKYFNGKFLISRAPVPLEHSEIYKDLMNLIFSIAQPTIMFRKTIALRAGGYRIEGHGEDLSFNLEMSKFGKLANLMQECVYYRVSNKSLTSTKMKEIEDVYRYTLYKWHQLNPIPFDQFLSNQKNSLITLIADLITFKGNYFFKNYLIFYGSNPCKSYIYLFLSVLLKPGAVFRYVCRKINYMGVKKH
jgi:glycosyltransferase involved in cell wall biosynthesis